MSNWKRYLLVIALNLSLGIILSMNCKGERCMIIILAAAYIVAAIIAYLPYLFFKTVNKPYKNRLFLFLLPSLLMFLIIVLYLLLGSTISVNLHNLLYIGLVILPNTALQLILFFIEKKSLNKHPL